jgi:hypothetical protein
VAPTNSNHYIDAAAVWQLTDMTTASATAASTRRMLQQQEPLQSVSVPIPDGVAGADFDEKPELSSRLKRLKGRMVTRIAPKKHDEGQLSSAVGTVDASLPATEESQYGIPILSSAAGQVTDAFSSDDFYYTAGLSSLSIFTVLTLFLVFYYTCCRRRRAT